MARGFNEPWEAYVERVQREAFPVAPPEPVKPVNALEEADRMIAEMTRRRADRARRDRQRANYDYKKRRAA